MRASSFLLVLTVAISSTNAQEDTDLHLEPIAVLGDARLRHAASITHIAPLSDGRRALSTARDGSVRLWDLESGRELRRYCPDQGEDIWNMVLLPDEREFLSCGEDNHVTRWNLETGEVVNRYKQTATVMRLALVPGENQFIACDSGKFPSLWDMDATKRLQRYKGHGDAIYSAIVSPDAQVLITGSEDGSIRAWQLASGKPLWAIEREDVEEAVEEFEELEDLFGVEKPAEEAPPRKEKPPGPGHSGDVFTVCFLPDGKQFASCSADHHVALWNTADGSAVWKTALPDRVTVIAVSPDGERLAATCGDNNLYLLRCADGQQLQAIEVPGDVHWPIAWSIDGKQLLSGGDGIIYRWDAATGEQLFPPPTNQHVKGALTCLAISPDGQRLYAAGENETVYVWDVARRKLVAVWATVEDVSSLHVCDGGKTLVIAGSDQMAIVDTASGDERHRAAVEQTLRCAVLADGGKLIVGTDWNGRLTAWSTKDGRGVYVQPQEEEGQRVAALVVSSDGQRIVAVREKFIDICKVSDGSRLARYAHHDEDSHAAAVLLPDDRGLLVFNDDRETPHVAAFIPPAVQQTVLQSPGAVRKLAMQLGNDDYATREQAMRKLIEIGPPVLADLPADDDDSEVRWRLGKIRTSVRERLIPTKALDRVMLSHRVGGAVAHPRRSRWAMVARTDSRAHVALGKLVGQTITIGSSTSDGHSPAALAFSPDGNQLYTGNRDGTISLFAVKATEAAAPAK